MRRSAESTPTKKHSAGSITSQNAAGGDYAHDADTLGGSSGSPVFSSTSHEVIALHHVGVGGNSMGRGTENHAVPMRSIVAALSARYPGLELGARAPSTSPAPPPDPPATADGYEPNDTRAGAMSIDAPFTSEGAEIAGAVGGVVDLDHFSFTAGDATSVHVELVHARGDLDVSAAGNVVVASVFGYRGATGSYTIAVR